MHMATGGTGGSSSIAQALSTLAGALLISNQSPQASPSVQNVSMPGGSTGDNSGSDTG